MQLATFNMEAQDFGPAVMGEIHALEARLIDGGWDVEIHIDEESLLREDGIIDCLWMQATLRAPRLSTVRSSLDTAGVISGYLKFGEAEYCIVGGLTMHMVDEDEC